MSDSGEHYRSVWDSYWGGITGAAGEIFWDSAPAQGAGADVKHFKHLVDPALPLIDVGCGHGAQTRVFAEHFARVVGVDVSSQAVELARRGQSAPGLSFRTLDLLAPQEAEALHGELGDANVYVRGVLHQFHGPERGIAVQSITALLGRRGALFVHELSPHAEAFFGALIARLGAPPAALARVLQLGIKPAGMKEEDWAALFPEARFEQLAGGEGAIVTTAPLPEGGVVEVPTWYRLLRPR